MKRRFVVLLFLFFPYTIAFSLDWDTKDYSGASIISFLEDFSEAFGVNIIGTIPANNIVLLSKVTDQYPEEVLSLVLTSMGLKYKKYAETIVILPSNEIETKLQNKKLKIYPFSFTNGREITRTLSSRYKNDIKFAFLDKYNSAVFSGYEDKVYEVYADLNSLDSPKSNYCVSFILKYWPSDAIIASFTLRAMLGSSFNVSSTLKSPEISSFSISGLLGSDDIGSLSISLDICFKTPDNSYVQAGENTFSLSPAVPCVEEFSIPSGKLICLVSYYQDYSSTIPFLNAEQHKDKRCYTKQDKLSYISENQSVFHRAKHSKIKKKFISQNASEIVADVAADNKINILFQESNNQKITCIIRNDIYYEEMLGIIARICNTRVRKVGNTWIIARKEKLRDVYEFPRVNRILHINCEEFSVMLKSLFYTLDIPCDVKCVSGEHLIFLDGEDYFKNISLETLRFLAEPIAEIKCGLFAKYHSNTFEKKGRYVATGDMKLEVSSDDSKLRLHVVPHFSREYGLYAVSYNGCLLASSNEEIMFTAVSRVPQGVDKTLFRWGDNGYQVGFMGSETIFINPLYPINDFPIGSSTASSSLDDAFSHSF